MQTRAEIKFAGRMGLRSQYGSSLIAFLLVLLLSAVLGPISFIFLMPPLTVGYAAFCIRVYRKEQADLDYVFSSGFSHYVRNLAGVLWMELFILLWSLLFIIPGIIKAFAYWMVPYLLADFPRVEPTEALKLSMRMTKGQKGRIFGMYLSFFGWWILSALTFGILELFYTGPYQYTSLAGLYLELKREALEKGVVRPEELM